MPTWPPPPRYSPWRRTPFCVATGGGDAKKGLVSGNSFADGLLFEIVSSLGYFCLNRRGRKKIT
jgi:hypothetical protein